MNRILRCAGPTPTNSSTRFSCPPAPPHRHFERSRPTFSSAFAPANASACGCEKSLLPLSSIGKATIAGGRFFVRLSEFLSTDTYSCMAYPTPHEFAGILHAQPVDEVVRQHVFEGVP